MKGEIKDLVNDAEQRARNVLRTTEEQVARAVCPLYDLDDRKRPLVGSALLLRTRSRVFLITAAHVLNHNRQTNLYLAGGNDFVQLKGESYRSEIYDFAFIPLSETIANELVRVKSLTEEDLDVDEIPDHHTLYAFVGYPVTKNRPLNGLRLQLSSSVFVVMPAEAQAYNDVEASPLTHFVGTFDRRRLVEPNVKGTVTGPDPHGLSGGGVWRMGRVNQLVSGATSEKLIGVGVRYCKPKKLLIGIRISLVISALINTYPELGVELPASTRIRVNVHRAS